MLAQKITQPTADSKTTQSKKTPACQLVKRADMMQTSKETVQETAVPRYDFVGIAG